VPPLTFAGTGVVLASVDNVAGPRTACRLGVDDEADRRARDIGGREGEKGRAGEVGPTWAAACWACSCAGERRGKRKG